MAMDTEVRADLFKKFQLHPTDTGSTEVQIALLTQRIADLSEHLADHRKDNHSRRGLLLMVGQRRKFLKFLQKKNYAKYQEIIKALGLRK